MNESNEPAAQQPVASSRSNRRGIAWTAVGLLGVCLAAIFVARHGQQPKGDGEIVREEPLAVAESWIGVEPVEVPHPFFEDGQWGYINNRGGVALIGARKPNRKRPATAALEWNDSDDFHGGLARVHVGGDFDDVMDAPPFWAGGAWYYVNAEGTIVGACHLDGDPARALGPRHEPGF